MCLNQHAEVHLGEAVDALETAAEAAGMMGRRLLWFSYQRAATG